MVYFPDMGPETQAGNAAREILQYLNFSCILLQGTSCSYVRPHVAIKTRCILALLDD